MPSSPQIDRSRTLSRRVSTIIGYSTLVAAGALLVFFLVVPVCVIMMRAFFDDGRFTLEYFKLLFDNNLQIESIINSLLIGLVTTVLCTVVSLPLATINVRYDFRGKALLSGLLLVPLILPPFVAAIGIQQFFSRRGSVNILLMQWGVIDRPIDWLSDGNQFWAVVILEVLHLYPIMYLNLSAALSNIDPSLEEMAESLGVRRLRRFKDIVWPLARPGYFAGAIIVFLWAMTDLGTPLLVGYDQTAPVRIFNYAKDTSANPIGFALVFVVLVITILVFATSKFMFTGRRYEMMARGHVTSRVQRASPARTIGIYALMLGITAFALIPHLGVLLVSVADEWFLTVVPDTYTLEHYGDVFGKELPFIGLRNSLIYSTLSMMLDLVLGLVIAFVVVRRLIPLAGVLDTLVMLPLALPGIVLAFGYLETYSGTFLDPVRNPAPLLVIAYAIRRLPFMVRAAAAGIQQTSVSLEEASATFGASRFHTLRKITIPLVAANLIAGSLLCFAYAMLEVSDSLILAVTERFYPVTKAIYALFLEIGSGANIASALGMITMVLISACLMIASILLGKKMGELFRAG